MSSNTKYADNAYIFYSHKHITNNVLYGAFKNVCKWIVHNKLSMYFSDNEERLNTCQNSKKITESMTR